MHLSVLTRDMDIQSTVHWQGMTRVTKFLYYTLGNITFECHQD